MSKIDKLNKLWVKKIIVLCMIVLSFFLLVQVDAVVLGMDGFVEDIARYVPMINGLAYSGVQQWHVAARYFSLVGLVLPLFVAWVILEDDVVARCKYGFTRMKTGKTQALGFVYFVVFPLFLFVVYLTIFAPYGYSSKPGNFGQTIFFFILNTNIGLLTLGSFFVVCFGQLLVFLVWIFLLPFAFAFKAK